jgi:hypothetical protein
MKAVMTASALFLAVAGLAALFLPQEIFGWLGAAASGGLTMLIQIGGALYLALAMVNWTAKGSLIGGIYNRPAALGNFTHFFIGAIVLVKGLMTGQTAAWVWIACAAYALFALGFGLIAFGSPVKPLTAPPTP